MDGIHQLVASGRTEVRPGWHEIETMAGTCMWIRDEDDFGWVPPDPPKPEPER